MCAITPPKNIAIIAIVGVAIASSLCERVLVFGGHYATPGITRTDTVRAARDTGGTCTNTVANFEVSGLVSQQQIPTTNL
jgi:hypothetical protein